MTTEADGLDTAGLLPPGVDVLGTRGRILVAGLRLFSRVGFHAASIRDIAREAGLQSASLYSHFASKEAVLAELVLVGHQELHRRLLDAVVGAGADPRDQLAQMVHAHVASHVEYPMLALVANTELKNLSPEAAAPSIALRNGASEFLVKVMQRGVDQELFDLCDPLTTIAAISTLGFSLARIYPDHTMGVAPDELAASSATLALRMVGAAPTTDQLQGDPT